jgi:hypothetical protein
MSCDEEVPTALTTATSSVMATMSEGLPMGCVAVAHATPGLAAAGSHASQSSAGSVALHSRVPSLPFALVLAVPS